MRKMVWVLPLLTLVAVAWLNVLECSTGEDSMAFRSGVERAFSHVRGWPFGAFARADEEGARLIQCSVVQGDTRLRRDVYVGAYPHLAWCTFSVVANLVVASFLLCVSVLLAVALRRLCDKMTCAGDDCQQGASPDD